MTNSKNVFEVVCMVVLVILFIDFLGWVSWGVSGQQPVDGFYIGAITSHILALF